MTGLSDRLQRELSAARSPREQEIASESRGDIGKVAMAWLPAGDYEQATSAWPDFAGSDRVAGPNGPLPQPKYCWAMQQVFVEYAEAGLPTMTIAPLRVAPFTAWCVEGGHQPDSPGARAEYAAYAANKADPGLIAFPPARNEPCWCGSKIKYKKCCAAKPSGAAQ